MDLTDQLAELVKFQGRLGKSCDEFNMFLVAWDFHSGDSSLFVVLPNLYQAQQYYDGLMGFVAEEDILFFPADELIVEQTISATGDFLFERINTLYTLLTGKKKIVITNVHGALKYEFTPRTWQESVFLLEAGQKIAIKDLLKKLVALGYEPVYTLAKTGEFSHRGSIVDIFPLGRSEPIRLDFFDEEIEVIKTFDIDTQRSLNKIKDCLILPVTEFIYSPEELKKAKERINSYLAEKELTKLEEETVNQNLYQLENHQNLQGLGHYMRFFKETTTVFDFTSAKRLYLIDPAKAFESYNRLLLDLNDFWGHLGGSTLGDLPFFANLHDLQFDVLIEGLRSIGDIDYEINAKEVASYKANPKEILNDFKRYNRNKYVVFSYTDEKKLARLKDYALDENVFLVEVDNFYDLKLGQINCLKGNYPAFDWVAGDLLVLNEETLYSTSDTPRKAKYKSIYKNAVKISKYDELEIGDYVVHYDYGIGKYLGIKTMQTGEIKRDFLYVLYGKGSGVYIPLEQLSAIMKYASKDVEGITLHEIGSASWARTKAKVRKRIHDISDQLIKLYAARKQALGFAFPKDSSLQADFENDFPYDLTPDQKKAITDVKRDMEQAMPMDRLICGDVGYGKTEVAMRAAFKAVLGGKQVCVLAPTTILAHQHYENFSKRMEKYGVRVELLNRFVLPSRQAVLIKELEKGSIDVMIGTHRVLSKDVVYKDLGLLIVDEEQRFGVSHKEKIKELKVNVDCLTLSATPIPRTLQMSMLGLRDLSMIETPPKNRYPIQTYILERSDRLIAEAMERELARGGQVFYLYNYVEQIEEIAHHLKSLLPQARICIGHGKLPKDQLEKRIAAFINREYNVLLCTTIIETGIDMPDTNTLIIHDADHLGLAQLYQIRGRVGRSNKIAYAYMMYEPRKILTETAEKRLKTIKEFNELGSGFKIAMRDLAIRGSGDLLGEEQSGFVESVGLDMYLKILNEEINSQKEDRVEEVKPLEETDISLATPLASRTIDSNYIQSEDLRIKVHRKIDALKSVVQLKELESELSDRFGELSSELKTYMYEKLLKSYCKRLNVMKIVSSDPKYLDLIFALDMNNKIDGRILFETSWQFPNIKILHKAGNPIVIRLSRLNLSALQGFTDLCCFFDRLLAMDFLRHN